MEIVLQPTASAKIAEYIRQADGEISGLGRGKYDEESGNILVSDVFIWKQECSAAATEVVDHQATFDLALGLKKDGVPLEELCVWWHSHADMQAFFSSTDTDTIAKWQNNKFLAAVVGNKKGEYKGYVSIKKPIPCVLTDVKVSHESPTVSMDDLIVKGLTDAEFDIEEFARELTSRVLSFRTISALVAEDIAAKVTTKTYTTYIPKASKSTWSKFRAKESELDMFEEIDEPEGMKGWGWSRAELLAIASNCLCNDCIDYINGDTHVFAYARHYKDIDGTYYNPDVMQKVTPKRDDLEELVAPPVVPLIIPQSTPKQFKKK